MQRGLGNEIAKKVMLVTVTVPLLNLAAYRRLFWIYIASRADECQCHSRITDGLRFCIIILCLRSHLTWESLYMAKWDYLWESLMPPWRLCHLVISDCFSASRPYSPDILDEWWGKLLYVEMAVFVRHLSSFPLIDSASLYSQKLLLLLPFLVNVIQGCDGGESVSNICVSDFIWIFILREVQVFLFLSTRMTLGYAFLSSFIISFVLQSGFYSSSW